MTREDFDDIHHRMPFVLTSDEIPEYQILYVGKQREDELGTYVFDIAPKQIEKNRRYFQGRIWVDDHDFQIVKTYGKNVPDIGVGKHRGGQENLFPNFTTWRQQIDGKYWFPVYTKVDDELHFSTGDVHVRQIVKYTELQALRIEREDHLRRAGDLERPAAVRNAAARRSAESPAETIARYRLSRSCFCLELRTHACKRLAKKSAERDSVEQILLPLRIGAAHHAHDVPAGVQIESAGLA